MNDYLQEAYDNLVNAAKEAGEVFAAGLQEFIEDSALAELLRQIASLAITLDTHLLSKTFISKKCGARKSDATSDSRVVVFKARENSNPKFVRCYARNNC